MNLVADIGGTNARFANTQSGSIALNEIMVFPCVDFPNLIDAIKHYTEKVELKYITEICLAVPGPTDFERINLPNSHWSFERQELQKAFNAKISIVNDYTAQLLCLDMLHDNDFEWIGEPRPVKGKVKSILGVGTGLGAAIMSKSGDILPSEAGHLGFSPTTEHEIEILKLLWRRYDRVSFERILSGHGLSNLYWANSILMGQERELSPEAVHEQALEGEPCALKTIEDFSAITGTVAGDLAIAAGSLGGVYLSGGILKEIYSILNLKLMRQRFEMKGRFSSYCSKISLGIVLVEHPGLLGSARVLMQEHY